jgi:hypothetical protein
VPELWTAIESARAGDGAPLLALAHDAASRDPDGTPRDGRSFNIVTNDFPCPEGWNLEAAKELAATLAAAAPVTGRTRVAPSVLCLGWQSHAPGLEMRATTAPPMLVIGGNRDAVTPGTWAPVMANKLGNGSHVITHDQRHHVAFFVNECARNAAVAHLLDPAQVPSISHCPAE